MKEPYSCAGPLATLLEDLPMEELAFTPVPVQPRRDGWTPDRQRGFVARLALGGCVATAARAVGMSKVTAYALRDRPGAESFAAAWDRAVRWGQDRMADIALERALYGQVTAIYRNGVKVGERFTYDNGLIGRVLSSPAGASSANSRPLKTNGISP